MNDREMLEWAEFVATKFGDARDGWIYSEDRDGLEHIRYKRDHTGYNHWTKRLGRALGEFRPRPRRNLSLVSTGLLGRWCMALTYLKKDRNLPDATVNGNIFHWSEDAEYVTLFQPRVGVKVLEFLKEHPDHPHATAIRDEMRNCMEMSWPQSEDKEKA